MAKHYLARTVTENPAYMQAKIRVPAGADKMHAGQVVVAEELDSGLYENLDVYTPAKVTDAAKDNIAIILNNGFETLTDNRRPEGQPDYTQYEYVAGEVLTAHRLLPEVRFEVSVDACGESVASATIVPGDNLIPEAGKYELKYSAKGTAVTAKNYLTVEAVRYFRIGGQFGADTAKTMIVRAKATDATA